VLIIGMVLEVGQIRPISQMMCWALAGVDKVQLKSTPVGCGHRQLDARRALSALSVAVTLHRQRKTPPNGFHFSLRMSYWRSGSVSEWRAVKNVAHFPYRLRGDALFRGTEDTRS
jgi:hypothetical protein